MFAFRDQAHQGIDIYRIRPQGPTRDLTVEDFAGNIGIVRRNLALALLAFIRRHAHKTHSLIAEGFQALYLHGITVLRFARLLLQACAGARLPGDGGFHKSPLQPR